MRSKILIAFLIALIFFSFSTLIAQNTTKGTEFWVALMDNIDLSSNGQPKFSFLISSDVNTAGAISLPAVGFSINFTANAGQVAEIFLPQAIFYPIGSEFVDNKGIKITSNDPISLTVHHHRMYFSEASIVLPISELGDDYMVMAHDDYYGAQPSEFIVAATEDSSVIEIIPTVFTVGFKPPGIAFTVNLNEGEVYQVQAMGDLTGTTIKEQNGKKIAVFSGAKQANVSCLWADNHLYDQNYPLPNWGTEYITVPFPVYSIVDTGGTYNYGGDVIRVLASTDQTEVYFNCSLKIVLNKGEYLDTLLFSPVKITSSFPIAVGQFKRSQDCSGLGDPTFILHRPLNFYSTRVVFNSLTDAIGSFLKHYINIIIPSTSTGLIKLDGISISSSFSLIPSNPNYSWATILVSETTHTLESDSGFYAFAYGFSDHNSYSYFLGYENIYSEANMMVNIGNDTTICKGDSITIGQAFPGYFYLWSSASGLDSSAITLAQPIVKPGITTTYNVALYDTTCMDTLTGSLTVDVICCMNLDLGNDKMICMGDSIIIGLPEVPDYIYNWSMTNGMDSSDLHLAQPVVNPSATITYYLFAEDTICNSTINDSITVILISSMADAGPDSIFCEDKSVIIGSPSVNGYNYDWLPASGLNNTSIAQPTATPAQTTTYFLTVNDTGNFCASAQDSVTLYVTASPVANAGNNMFICENDSALIGTPGISGYNYSWQPSSGLNNPAIAQPLAAPQEFTTYILTVTDTGNHCPDITDSISIFVVAPPVANAGNDTMICENDSVLIGTPGISGYDYSWQPYSGLNNDVIAQPIAFPGQSTIYILKVTDFGNYCSPAYDAITIQINPSSVADALGMAGNDTTICTKNGGVIIGTPAITGYQYSWEPVQSADAQPYVFPTQTTNYIVTVVNMNDTALCKLAGTDTILVAVVDCDTIEASANQTNLLFIPNIFTPNGDGNNDVLYVRGRNISNLYFTVYDRWGEKVFETTDKTIGWDGTFLGKPINSGVFIYYATVVFADGTGEKQKGNLTLLK